MAKKIILIVVLSSLILLSGCSINNTITNTNVIGSNEFSNSTTTASTTKELEKNKDQDKEYKFIKDYSITVTVGGIVGIFKKSYKIGDTVKGQTRFDGVEVRIAPHSERNEGEVSSASYQEFIIIPLEYLRLNETINPSIGNQKILQLYESCGDDLGVCAPGLKCAYPCGIPGCTNSCLPKDEPARP